MCYAFNLYIEKMRFVRNAGYVKYLTKKCHEQSRDMERKLESKCDKITNADDLDRFAEHVIDQTNKLSRHEEELAAYLLENADAIKSIFSLQRDEQQHASRTQQQSPATPDVSHQQSQQPQKNSRSKRGRNRDNRRQRQRGDRGRSPPQEEVHVPHMRVQPWPGDATRSGPRDQATYQDHSDAGGTAPSHHRGTLRQGRHLPQHGGPMQEGHQGHGGTGCYHCGSPDLIDDEVHGDIVCSHCGTCVKYISDAADNCIPFKDLGHYKSLSQFFHNGNCYKRINYFAEILNQLMGQQNESVPQHIFAKVHRVVADEVDEPYEVTGPVVRRALQKLRLGRYYQFAHLIANKISGNANLTTLTHHHTDEMLRLFKKIQRPFELHRGRRRNFLSYTYILWQFFMILGLPENCSYLNMPKCTKRLVEKDNLWGKICQETGLPYYSYTEHNNKNKLKSRGVL